jgi:hypothetical protein
MRIFNTRIFENRQNPRLRIKRRGLCKRGIITVAEGAHEKEKLYGHK